MDTRIESDYICNIELRFWNGSLSEILVHYGFSLLVKTCINWAQQYYFICLNFIYRKILINSSSNPFIFI